MSETVLKQIAALEKLSHTEVQERWRTLLGAEPPRYSKAFMVKRLAHRLQELAHGGLSRDTRDQMDRLLDEAGYDELAGKRRRRRRREDIPVLGTRLVREWEGERHEVTVVQKGFEYRGRRYRSLSAIANTITGGHWNGKVFFGLRRGRGRDGS